VVIAVVIIGLLFLLAKRNVTQNQRADDDFLLNDGYPTDSSPEESNGDSASSSSDVARVAAEAKVWAAREAEWKALERRELLRQWEEETRRETLRVWKSGEAARNAAEATKVRNATLKTHALFSDGAKKLMAQWSPPRRGPERTSGHGHKHPPRYVGHGHGPSGHGIDTLEAIRVAGSRR
jgi:hypothetical protein